MYLQNEFKESDKITSDAFAMACVYHFLDNRPMFGSERELQLMKEFLPSITLEEVNELAAQWIIEKNRAVVITAPEKPSVKLPTEEEIRNVLAEAKNLKTEPVIMTGSVYLNL